MDKGIPQLLLSFVLQFVFVVPFGIDEDDVLYPSLS
jgi:hypothetical protein